MNLYDSNIQVILKLLKLDDIIIDVMSACIKGYSEVS